MDDEADEGDVLSQIEELNETIESYESQLMDLEEQTDELRRERSTLMKKIEKEKKKAP
jgi:phage shock protein A